MRPATTTPAPKTPPKPILITLDRSPAALELEAAAAEPDDEAEPVIDPEAEDPADV